MTATGLPFDDIRALIAAMPAADPDAMARVTARDATLVKPPGALGRLEDLALWAAGWQGKATPTCQRPMIALFGSDHGVTKHGISPFPMAVTRQMLETFGAG